MVDLVLPILPATFEKITLDQILRRILAYSILFFLAVRPVRYGRDKNGQIKSRLDPYRFSQNIRKNPEMERKQERVYPVRFYRIVFLDLTRIYTIFEISESLVSLGDKL